MSLETIAKREIKGSKLPECLSFVHQESIGDLTKCKQTLSPSRNTINEIYDSNQVSGTSLILVESYDDALSKFVINIDTIEKQLDYVYPFTLITVSPFEEYVENISKYLLARGYFELKVK